MVKRKFSILAGSLITPTRTLESVIIEIRNQKISRVSSQKRTSNKSHPDHNTHFDLDASDAIIVPGMVDIQVNGALGWSFQAKDMPFWGNILDFHLKAGTTTFFPTLITAPKDVLLTSLVNLSEFLPHQLSPTLPGIHLEGPFLSPERSGAHDPASLCLPDIDFFNQLIEASNNSIKLLTIAPELPGSEKLIKSAVQKSILVSAGHSSARMKSMVAAYHEGLTFITHAGNASDWPHREVGDLGFLSSEPGVVGALLSLPGLAGSLIMDGYHVHPALLSPMLKVKDPDHLVLISDASPVAGCPPGEYESGGLVVTIHPQGFATSGRGGGWLAGSTITLLQAVQRSVQLANIPLQQAVQMATLTPSKWLKIDHKKGQIRAGWDADLLVLNQDLSLRHVIAGGELLE